MADLRHAPPTAARGRLPGMAQPLALAVLASLLAACQAGGYALECNQGVQRETCEQVGAFAFQNADVAASRMHVEARTCTRYFDAPPADTRCWSVRMEKSGDFVVVAVTQTGDGDLTVAHDLNPIFPPPSGD